MRAESHLRIKLNENNESDLMREEIMIKEANLVNKKCLRHAIVILKYRILRSDDCGGKKGNN